MLVEKFLIAFLTNFHIRKLQHATKKMLEIKDTTKMPHRVIAPAQKELGTLALMLSAHQRSAQRTHLYVHRCINEIFFQFFLIDVYF